MNTFIAGAAHIALIGIGATALMDAWLLLLQRLGMPGLNVAMIGRWAGHWRHGIWKHDAIAKAAPIRGERALGWSVHYATGIAFAALLPAICGLDWLHKPTLLPALCVGICTVAAPWLLMQPAMGAGIASSRTPTPAKNRGQKPGKPHRFRTRPVPGRRLHRMDLAMKAFSLRDSFTQLEMDITP